ncbi:MAG: GldG family protein [Chloroflexi bacterium]|nr:GldG family protein [Chloroflexota bacterium]
MAGKGKMPRLLGPLAPYFETMNASNAAVFAGVASLLTSGLIFLVASSLKGTGFAFLALGAILLLFAVVKSAGKIGQTMRTRQGFYGVNSVAMVLLFLAIAAIVIYVGAQNNHRADTTASKQFSLAKQTTQVLSGLGENVEAVAFLTPNDPLQSTIRSHVLDLLDEYKRKSDKFSYRVVDPDLSPSEARKYGLNPDADPATVVFSTPSGALQPVSSLVFVSSQSQFIPNRRLEQDFTQALLSVTHKQQKVVYFLTRHGERDPGNNDAVSGYSRAAQGLQSDNYDIRTLDLVTTQTVPADAAVVVVASPKQEMTPDEAKALDTWLRAGGKMFFLLDPDTPQTYRDLLKTWGVDVPQGTIVDAISAVQTDPRAPLVHRDHYSFGSNVSPVVRPLTDSTFYDQSAAIRPVDPKQATDLNQPPVFYIDNANRYYLIPIALTSGPVSWVETDPKTNHFDSGEIQGPLAIGATVEAYAPFKEPLPNPVPDKTTQIVVFGDSDFASNRFFTSFANGDMFLNSVNWLAADQSLISVRPKLDAPRLLIVTNGKWNFIRWSSLLVLPVVVASAGVVVWWRRR